MKKTQWFKIYNSISPAKVQEMINADIDKYGEEWQIKQVSPVGELNALAVLWERKK